MGVRPVEQHSCRASVVPERTEHEGPPRIRCGDCVGESRSVPSESESLSRNRTFAHRMFSWQGCSLGFAVTSSTTFRCQSSRRQWAGVVRLALLIFPLIGVGMWIRGQQGGPLLLALLAILSVVFFIDAVLLPLNVELRGEGLIIRRLGAARFIPYATIASVETFERDGAGVRDERNEDRTVGWTVYGVLALTLTDGRTVTLGAGQEMAKPGTSRALGLRRDGGTREAILLARAIRERIRAWRDREPADPILEHHLAQQGRSVAAWLRDIRALLDEGRTTYRTSGVNKDALLRILEDPAAPGDVRIGAAHAIREVATPDEARRARVAIEACASPKLRVALACALSDSSDEASMERDLVRATSSER